MPPPRWTQDRFFWPASGTITAERRRPAVFLNGLISKHLSQALRMFRTPGALGRYSEVKPHARTVRRASVSFPLTPALSLGERENALQSL